MSAQHQNSSKLKHLAAPAGRERANATAVTLAEASVDSPSIQHSGGSAALQLERIAHDFNNVLTLVLGYGENLLKALPKGHPGRSFAEEICHAAKAGGRLSVKLMSMAQSGRTEHSDPMLK
jgi:hypothetical protein